MVLSYSLERQKVPETVAQDAQVPVAIERALGHLLGVECGRQGPAPPQLWGREQGQGATLECSAGRAGGRKGGEGQQETRITRRGRRGEEVGQAKEDLRREEDTGEGGVQRGERAVLQEQPPHAARPASPSPRQAANED